MSRYTITRDLQIASISGGGAGWCCASWAASKDPGRTAVAGAELWPSWNGDRNSRLGLLNTKARGFIISHWNGIHEYFWYLHFGVPFIGELKIREMASLRSFRGDRSDSSPFRGKASRPGALQPNPKVKAGNMQIRCLADWSSHQISPDIQRWFAPLVSHVSYVYIYIICNMEDTAPRISPRKVPLFGCTTLRNRPCVLLTRSLLLRAAGDWRC